MARRTNATRKNVIEAKEKAARAIELRKEGKTFQEIADEVGYASREAAYGAVKRAIQDVVREPTKELIEIELMRLDAMWEIHYLNAQTGDTRALDACMKLMERRAKYLGIDAPMEVNNKTSFTNPDGTPITAPTVVQLVAVQPGASPIAGGTTAEAGQATNDGGHGED